MKTRIHILYLIDSLQHFGGTETSLLQLLRGLDKRRFWPLVCPLDPADSSVIRCFREHGIAVQPLPLSRIYGLRAVQQALQFKQILRKNRIDIVQTIHFGSDVFGAGCSRLFGVPVVISSRRDMGFVENHRRHLVARRVANQLADCILTNSKVMARQLGETEGRQFDKITTIYNGIDLQRFKLTIDRQQKLTSLHLSSQRPVIACVANLRPIKGIEYYIQAAARVIHEFPATQFLLIGGSAAGNRRLDSYGRELQAMIEKCQLGSNFYMLGARSDVAEILACTDVFVLPSLSEGFSNAILEAMACGVPVIATAVGGNPEAVVHRQTGYIVPAEDPAAIAEAMIQLLKDPALRQQMGAAGRWRAEQLFSLEKMVREMQTLYTSLVANNSRRKFEEGRLS